MAADFGDAPAPYPTLLAADGARHTDLGPDFLRLGAAFGAEADGQPSTGADADAGDDGVVFGEVRVGQLDAEVTVTVSNAPSGAKLDGWIDFNGDGSWGGANEHVFASVAVVEGVNTLTFDVPSGAISGETYARFRLSTTGGLGVQGLAADGEVEDYRFSITPPGPVGVAFGSRNDMGSTFYEGASALADLDGDGDFDIVVADWGQDAIVWQENLEGGVFVEHILSRSLDGAATVHTVDLDGDGRLDIVYTAENARQIGWLRNTGTPNFTKQTLFSTASEENVVSISDIDADGDFDIVTTSWLYDTVAWYENNGTQSFAKHIIDTDADRVVFAVVAELTGDGILDIAYPCLGSDGLFRFRLQAGNGAGGFVDRGSIDSRGPTLSYVQSVDLDGDGDLDIVGKHTGGYSYISWYENRGVAGFTRHELAETEGVVTPFFPADLDGDGDVDLILNTNSVGAYWLENIGGGGFLRSPLTDSGRVDHVNDMDGDGDLDLIYAGSVLGWYENRPEVSLSAEAEYAAEESVAPLQVSFQLNAPLSAPIAATFFISGSAKLGVDYLLEGAESDDGQTFTVVIPAGQAVATIGIALQDDTLFEFDESVTLTLVERDGLGSGDVPSLTVWITSAELGGDFGDSPMPYPTAIESDGARHGNVSADGIRLGVTVTAEPFGLGSINADADSGDDGVVFGEMRVGQLDSVLLVTVSNASEGAKLDGWIDFNGDGSWGGPQEHVFADISVVDGVNTLLVDIPSWAAPGVSHARFRLSSRGGLKVTGYAEDGEVEDYAVTIKPAASHSSAFATGAIVAQESPFKNAIAVDIDGDGDLDIVSHSSSGSPILLFENDGAANYRQRVIYSTNFGVNHLMTADVDSDGDTDILVALTAASNGLVILENLGAATFVPIVTSTTIPSARGVLVADMDGDGDPDLVAPSYDNDRIAWYENQGQYTFVSRAVTSLADGASSVHVVDLDRDGDLDVLSTSALDDTVAWYENDGAQNFTRRVITTAADGARVVLTADVDLDGDLDVVSASSADSTIAWYENDGAENFARRVISTALESPVTLLVADVDGDGRMDVISGSGAVTASSGSVIYFRNQGDGSFEERLVATGVGSVSSLQAADVDKDGDLDILAALSSARKVLWFEHVYDASLDSTTGDWFEGSGAWTLEFSIPAPVDQPTELAFSVDGEGVSGADFELTGAASFDGSRGIVVIPAGQTSATISLTATEDGLYEFDESVTVSLLRGPGEIAEPLISLTNAIRSTDYGASFGDAPAPYATTLEDDGARHTNVGDGSLRLGVLANGVPDGTPSTTASSNLSDDGVVFGELRVGDNSAVVTVSVSNASAGAKLDGWIDFNGDGSWGGVGEQVFTSVPVVEGENELTFSIPAAVASGTTTFARFRLSSAGGLIPTGAADNGEVEDYAVTLLPPALTTGVFGAPTQLLPASEVLSDSSGSSPVVPVDLDGDGDLDLVVLRPPGYGYNFWYENDGGSFGPGRVLVEAATAIRFADLDRDGDLDIVAAIYSNLVWHENRGSDGFVTHDIAPNAVSSFGAPMTVADFNNDGWLDIATVSGNSDILLWRRSDTTTTYTSLKIGSGGLIGPYSLAAGDLDGDGRLDLVVSGNDFPFGDTVGLFQTIPHQFVRRVIDGSQSPLSIPIDMDSDGDLDLVTQFTAGTGWLENNGVGSFASGTIGGASGNPNSVAAADFDGDGDIDIVEASEGTAFDPPSFTLFTNDGSQTFEAAAIDPALLVYTSVFAADMDNDGAIDLIAVSPNLGVRLYKQPLRATISSSSPAILPEDGGSYVVRLELSTEAKTDIEVPFTISGDATPGVDYVLSGADSITGLAGLATVPAGSRWIDLTITTTPDSTPELFETIVLSIGHRPEDQLVRRIAGDSDAGDYGDAPATYPVTVAQGGAAHLAVGPRLGASRTTEPQGAPSADAAGDSGDDGVVFGDLRVGSAGAVVSVSVENAPAGAFVDAWIDFNADGSWDGEREQVFASYPVSEGLNVLTLETPGWAIAGETFARVRLSSAGGLATTGNAADGEVEDFSVTIVSPVGGTIDFSVSGIGPTGSSIAVVEPIDMDRDGLVDVVTATMSGVISLLSNDGGSVFTSQTLASVGSIVRDLAIDDIDSDGDYDIAVAVQDPFGNNSLLLLRNDGAAGFSPVAVAQGVEGALSIALVDVDGDGLKDILAGGFVSSLSLSARISDGEIAWYRSDVTGGFTSIVVDESLGPVTSIGAADLDGDGDLDLYASALGAGGLVILRNGGAEDFTREVVAPGPASSSLIAGGKVQAVDFDGDGDLDLLRAPGGANPTLTWFENDGSAVFSARNILSGAGYISGVIAADLDGDGDLDLAFSLLSSAPEGSPAWLESRLSGDANDDGSVDLADWESWRTSYGATSGAGLSADLTGDGLVNAADYALWRDAYESGALSRVYITRAATWGVQSNTLAATDLDGDNDLDLVAGTATQAVWLQNAHASPAELFSRQSEPTSNEEPSGPDDFSEIVASGTLQLAVGMISEASDTMFSGRRFSHLRPRSHSPQVRNLPLSLDEGGSVVEKSHHAIDEAFVAEPRTRFASDNDADPFAILDSAFSKVAV